MIVCGQRGSPVSRSIFSITFWQPFSMQLNRPNIAFLFLLLRKHAKRNGGTLFAVDSSEPINSTFIDSFFKNKRSRTCVLAGVAVVCANTSYNWIYHWYKLRRKSIFSPSARPSRPFCPTKSILYWISIRVHKIPTRARVFTRTKRTDHFYLVFGCARFWTDDMQHTHKWW